MAIDAVRYVGWQRLASGSPWKRIDASESATKGECYDKLMTVCELAGKAPAGSEYVILPVGHYPRRQDYEHREMRPRR